MTKVIVLKQRPVKDTISISLPVVKQLAEAGDKELRAFLRNLLELEHTIHDAHWLDLLTAFGGDKMADWIYMRAKVARLDRTKECSVRFTDRQEQLLKERMINQDFLKSLQALHPCYAEFVVDLAELMNWNLSNDQELISEPKLEGEVE